MSGWIRVERKVFSDEFFPREPMSEREAWLWMLANAAWDDTTHRVGGKVMEVPRGSFMTTLRELQSVFMWRSDTKVRNFLKRLESERTVKRTTCGPRNAPKTHVTICKYDEYQSPKRTENAPETHRERTEKRSKETNINNKQGSSNEEHVQAAVEIWNAVATSAGWSQVQKISKPRFSAISARLRECGGLNGWQHAVNRAAASDFLTGQTSRPFFASFDWLTKPANFTKLMEGNYDNRTRANPTASNPGRSTGHDSLMAGFAKSAHSEPAPSGSDFGRGEPPFGADNTSMGGWQDCNPSQPLLRVIGSE